MKKFYLTLLAVVTMVPMTAAVNDAVRPKAYRFDVTGLHRVTNVDSHLPQSVTGEIGVGAKKRSSAGKITSIDDLAKKFAMAYYYWDNDNSYWAGYICPLEIKPVEGSSTEVKISNFWSEGTYDLDATVDLDAGTITIPKQPVITYLGIDSYVQKADRIGNSPVAVDEPIVLTIEEDGTVSYGGFWGLFYYSGDGSEAYCYEFCLYVMTVNTNSVMKATMSDDYGEYTETYHVNAEKDDNRLAVYGFYGVDYANPIYFDIDTDNKTATATNQVVFTQNYYDYYLSTPKATGISTVVTADISGDNNNKLVFSDWGISANGSFVVTSSGAMIETDIDLTGNTGVEGVVTGDDTAVRPAKPEYFNLQGVKVLNPESGKLYIRRQGSDVKKVIL